MDTASALKSFGLTNQEALMYITLLAHGPQTGYEAAKRTGISRSNAYSALAALTEKGGAMKAAGKAGKFSATPKKEFLKRLHDNSLQAINFLDRELPDRIQDEKPYLTVSGHENVVDKMCSMIGAVKSHVYVSAHSEEAAHITTALKACAARGHKTVLISDQNFDVQGITMHIKPQEVGHVKIIADTKAVLTGSVAAKSAAQCLFSENEHLVKLMREAFLNELELIERDRSQ